MNLVQFDVLQIITVNTNVGDFQAKRLPNMKIGINLTKLLQPRTPAEAGLSCNQQSLKQRKQSSICSLLQSLLLKNNCLLLLATMTTTTTTVFSFTTRFFRLNSITWWRKPDGASTNNTECNTDSQTLYPWKAFRIIYIACRHELLCSLNLTHQIN